MTRLLAEAWLSRRSNAGNPDFCGKASHGTVTAALAHGVPLVCLPNTTSDQPALAA